jgi:hypothetical protein
MTISEIIKNLLNIKMEEIDKLLLAKFHVRKRFVEKKDALFILSLRTNQRLGRFLSATDNDLIKQEKWIESYKEKEKAQKEFYFIFEGEDNIPYGLSRIYNIDKCSFEIGSWLFAGYSPERLSILADLCTRDFAFERFNFEYCRFEVRKENKAVIGYHKRFKPELVGEDELNNYYKLSRDKYLTFRNKILNIYYYGAK